MRLFIPEIGSGNAAPTGALRAVDLDKATLLGKGGEKVVYRDPDHPRSRALAVYHDPTPARAAKIQNILALNLKFPSGILAPDHAVMNDKNAIVGFGMPQLGRQFAKWKDLFLPSFCSNNLITTKTVAGMGVTVLKQLNSIHNRKIVVGDFNDGGLFFDPSDYSIAWGDVDSWRVGGPCIVGTELYLVPTLYNKDLTNQDLFEAWMDDYSYAVLLFRALLRKHPFKAGDHPQFGGVLQRAHAGVTVLDTGVDTKGLKAFYPGLLSDDLADALLKHLKLKVKGPFPLDVLEKYHDELTECSGCHSWYPASRPNCPVCSDVTVVNVKQLLGVDVVDMIETHGRILFVQLDGSTVLCIAEEYGNLILYRKDAGQPAIKTPLDLRYERSMKFGYFQGTVVICVDDKSTNEDGSIYLLDVSIGKAQFVNQTSTGIFSGGDPVFATSNRFLYRLAGNVLVREKRFGPADLLSRAVTQIFRNQCRFAVDPNPPPSRETICGVNRDVAAEHWFVSVGDKTGEQFSTRSIHIVPLQSKESLTDMEIYFDNQTVLIVRQTMLRGRIRVRLETVNTDNGEVRSSEILDPSTNPQWDSVHGKAFKNGLVMHSTDNGVVVEVLKDHTVRPVKGTVSIVTNDDRLNQYGGGILVTRHNRIILVNPK